MVFFIPLLTYTGHTTNEDASKNVQAASSYANIFNINLSRGIISFTFDDGLISQYETAYPIMRGFGYNGTIYVIANRTMLATQNVTLSVGRRNIDIGQAKKMQDNGWEVGDHTLNHVWLTSLSGDELVEELVFSKYLLEKNGLNISTFAFPYGLFNEEVINLTKEHYLASRPVIFGYNNLSSLDKWRLKSVWMYSNDSSDKICSSINYARENKYWLILIFHHIGPEKETNLDITESVFKEILECVRKGDLEVKTVKEVIEFYNGGK